MPRQHGCQPVKQLLQEGWYFDALGNGLCFEFIQLASEQSQNRATFRVRQNIIPVINVALARNLYSFNGGMHMKNNATVSFAGNSPWWQIGLCSPVSWTIELLPTAQQPPSCCYQCLCPLWGQTNSFVPMRHTVLPCACAVTFSLVIVVWSAQTAAIAFMTR